MIRSLTAAALLAMPLLAPSGSASAQSPGFCQDRVTMGQINSYIRITPTGREMTRHREFSTVLTATGGHRVTVFLHMDTLPGAESLPAGQWDLTAGGSQAVLLARLPGDTNVTASQVRSAMRVSCWFPPN